MHGSLDYSYEPQLHRALVPPAAVPHSWSVSVSGWFVGLFSVPCETPTLSISKLGSPEPRSLEAPAQVL